MPDLRHAEELPGRETKLSAGEGVKHNEPMDDEEKVLAGRADANMPALWTKDVPGG